MTYDCEQPVWDERGGRKRVPLTTDPRRCPKSAEWVMGRRVGSLRLCTKHADQAIREHLEACMGMAPTMQMLPMGEDGGVAEYAV